MKRSGILGIIVSLFLICGVSSAYFPYKSEWNCSKIEDKEAREMCENEMSFAKFTETTGTREMSTTCCSYLDHDPKFNLRREQVTAFGGLDKRTNEASEEIKNKPDQDRALISGSVQQLTDLILKLSTQIYEEASNKIQATKMLSSLFKTCSENNKNLEARIVCKYFAYDLIGKEPKITPISLSDITPAFKKEKNLIQRSVQFSDLNEHYTPINYHYASIRTMYHLGDFAFGLMDSYNYFDNDSDTDFFKLLVLKAGDSHWQDFANIKANISLIGESTLSFEKHTLNLFIPVVNNKEKENERLTAQFQMQRDGVRKLVGCFEEKFNAIQASSEDRISRKKLPLKSCQTLGIEVKTTLGR
ncbi:hypothetical protein D8B45_01985 [Candidatus Gracilibacteria bacterium]|nr:MAG: hypothetical protein D8B45_01985 [Candidatus Gracilibacteria bacterium]